MANKCPPDLEDCLHSQPAKTTRPLSIELPVRHRLQPLRQGDLDCLCGLYSAVNAARILLADRAPMAIGDSARVMSAAALRVARKSGLHSALTEGLDLRRRLAMARHVAQLASTSSFQMQIERPTISKWRTIGDAFAWIDQSLDHGKPVLIRLIGPNFDHFTVVAASTASALLFFDSGSRRYVRKSTCQLRSGTNVIPPESILRLALSRQD